jgi:hypothetical protein
MVAGDVGIAAHHFIVDQFGRRYMLADLEAVGAGDDRRGGCGCIGHEKLLLNYGIPNAGAGRHHRHDDAIAVFG